MNPLMKPRKRKGNVFKRVVDQLQAHSFRAVAARATCTGILLLVQLNQNNIYSWVPSYKSTDTLAENYYH